MRFSIVHAVVCSVFAAGACAQQVFIDNNSASTGTTNAFPFAQTGGFTTLHVYTAAQLAAGGVTACSVLTDLAVAPSTGTTGIYSAPQARLSIGNMANTPAIAGAWEANLANPSVAHDLTSGAFTFPWTLNVWTPLPGVAGAGFVWDGVHDIGVYLTTSTGVTGTFQARRTGTNLRHAVTVFNPTNNAPTSNGLFAMKVRLTFTTGAPYYQVNQAGASFDIDGISSGACSPAIVNRAQNVNSVLNFASTLLGYGYELAYTAPEGLLSAPAGAIVLPNTGQLLNVNLGAPSVVFLNNLTFPPFPGNFSFGLSFPYPVSVSGQMALLDPTNPDGFVLSGGCTLNVQ